MAQMAIKCADCGRFVPYGEMMPGGGARHEFVPLSEFGPQLSEWICKSCVSKDIAQPTGDLG